LDIEALGGRDALEKIEKRVHSKAWHHEKDRLCELMMPIKKAKKQAKSYASFHKLRWRKRVNFMQD
jgi:hypothetical protein